MENVVIVDYVRTPFTRAADPTSGKAPGKLAHVDPADMVVATVNALLERTGANPKDIENLILGCVHQEAEQGLNLARLAVLHEECKLPLTVQGDTVDKFCGSSLRTIAMAKNDILAGEADLIIAAGVQSMSRIPMGGWNLLMNKKVYKGNAKSFMNMGLTAENLAEKYGISREWQEDFAIKSHQKAALAREKGYYKDEIVPVGGVSEDDNIRPDTNKEQIAKLGPAFKESGSVTAATSSPLTDGAGALLLASESYAKKNNLPVLAVIKAYAGSGCAPEVMGLGPVDSIKKLLDREGLTMADIARFEVNEAFGGQIGGVLEEMEIQNMTLDTNKLNIDGGAIALGHPLGASGTRLIGHLAKILQRTGERYGVAAACMGGGQGGAVLVENPNYTKAPKPTI